MKKVVLTLLLVISSLAVAAQVDTVGYSRFRFGGYGEMLGQFMDYGSNRFGGTSDGSPRGYRAAVSIPRFVLAFDYKFNSCWILGAEIEFEAGGVGSAVEIENSENGEYETEIEKGGEVALEQLHITRLFNKHINLRVGHLIVPVGLTNAHHEPINFFGPTRPQSETSLLPSTWHETGLELFGSFGRGFNWQAMIVAGLNANGFDRDEWIIGGTPGYFEVDNFTSLGYVGRIDYSGIKGLRTGISAYYCHDAGRNADKDHFYSSIGRIPVWIATWDAQYRSKWVTARGNITMGGVGNSAALSDANRMLSNKSPYSRLVPIAKNAFGAGIEAGINIKKFTPYARYEYYNPQFLGEKGQTMDSRLEVSQWQIGLNWFALPNLVVKGAWVSRRVGGGKYNSENEFQVGVAYIGWFVKK